MRRSWLEFMRSTHTLWNMTVYDGDAVCEVLPASEGQVLFQDLPTIWKAPGNKWIVDSDIIYIDI